MARKSKEAERTPTQASLLSLPPELRNQIYRYTPLQDDWITLSPSQASEPSLLSTCRQIRQEARSIFLYENKFTVSVRDLYYPVPSAHWYNLPYPLTRESHLKGYTKEWQNLKAWLADYHQGSVVGFRAQSDGWRRHQIVSKAFDIVDSLNDVEWEVVEKVLESFREGTELGTMNWSGV